MMGQLGLRPIVIQPLMHPPLKDRRPPELLYTRSSNSMYRSSLGMFRAMTAVSPCRCQMK